MLPILALTLAVSLSVGYAKPPSKIINGQKADISDFPYQVSIQLYGYFHNCGGTILDATTILTAAHCVVGVTEPMEVVTGSTDIRDRRSDNVFEVSEFTYHEKYNVSDNLANDVAVLKLSKPIPFNENQKPIGLPTKDVPDGASVMATGWGAFYNDGKKRKERPWLLKLPMKTMSLQQCQKTYGPGIINDGQVCAAGKPATGVCKGDSGGPLAYGNEVVGIVSWGNLPCATKYPDVFTRVYKYVPWIKQHM